MRRFLCFKYSANMITLHFIVASFRETFYTYCKSMIWSFYLISYILEHVYDFLSYTRYTVCLWSKSMDQQPTLIFFCKVALSKLLSKNPFSLNGDGNFVRVLLFRNRIFIILFASNFIRQGRMDHSRRELFLCPHSAWYGVYRMRNLLNTITFDHVHINEQ